MGVEKIPWETKLAILARYKETQGTAVVPTRYIDPASGFRLGGWVHHLRQTKSKLTLAQVQILENMGFVWNASKEWPWETKLEALKRFYDDHSHYRVPRFYVDEASGFKLGQWVPSLRRKNACLKPARRRDLEKIGFFNGSELFNNNSTDDNNSTTYNDGEEGEDDDDDEGEREDSGFSPTISSAGGEQHYTSPLEPVSSAAHVVTTTTSSSSSHNNNNNNNNPIVFPVMPQMVLGVSTSGVDDSCHNMFLGAGAEEAMMNMINGTTAMGTTSNTAVLETISHGLAAMKQSLANLKTPVPSASFEDPAVQIYEL